VNQKKARAARHTQVAATPSPAPFWTLTRALLVGAAVLLVLGASFVIPKLTGGRSAAAHSGMEPVGAGPMLGTAPRFKERDVLTGQTISSTTLRGHQTLLFFSEGVMCQACLQQISDIDAVGAELARRHVQLVSITPDSHADLKQAISQYGIRSPMISDSNRNMSNAFNMLGLGMHADTPGHAFVLINGAGRVLWQRDYYQAPWRAMYVKPEQLLKDIPQ
jgi:peroxiredoxin Q/BCP